jgi:predicted nucleic acid-binding protein
MKKLKLYLETSVWNFYFADDAPEKKEVTLRFFEKIRQGNYEVFISEIVLDEIARASDEKVMLLSDLIREYQPVNLGIKKEIFKLAPKIYFRKCIA